MKIVWLLAQLTAVAMVIGGCAPMVSSPPVAMPVAQPSPELKIQYQTHSLPQVTIHSLQIPVQAFQVIPVLVDGVADVADFVRQFGAIAAINGGFFDPVNQKSTSYVTQQGKLVAEPHHNERLMENPDLVPYLPKILNRSEFRRYRCGSVFRYAIARHRDPSPPDCQLIDALGGGPRLLPENTAEQEGFVDFANGTLVRDTIGSYQPNARSAIGITDRGDILLVMAAQKPGGAGLSLPDLATFMKTLGVTQAMNLDGGTSSALYFENKTLYGKLNEAGQPTGRPVKSVLLVQPVEKGGGEGVDG